MNATAITVVILFGVSLLLFVGLHLWVYAGLWLQGRALRRRLAEDGRTLSIDEAESLVRAGNGTIVVDAPTLGWNVSRVWWAPSGLMIPRPDAWENDRMCPPEDEANFERLIDPEHGAAKLICSFLINNQTHRFLQQHFGLETCGYIFTGGVEFERSLENRQV